MAENKQYYICVPGAKVEVTREVYLTYHRMARQARYQDEKDARHGKVLYSDLDADGLLGEEMIPDQDSASVEESAITAVLCEKLRWSIAQLPVLEQELIHALYFEGLTERQLSKRTGTHYMTIHSRKTNILSKLKKLMEN